jgi:GMP synthase (glutamine-hydrolysing)
MLLSGGVDSTVCAALVTKALGQERVIAIHIDNGFMRKNESEQVFILLSNYNYYN